LKGFAGAVKDKPILGNTANSQFLGLGSLARQKTSRNIVILRLSQKRISEIIGNANFGNIDTLLSQGHDMDLSS
jgi:hypothetical protein